MLRRDDIVSETDLREAAEKVAAYLAIAENRQRTVSPPPSGGHTRELRRRNAPTFKCRGRDSNPHGVTPTEF